jgi:hypothetical protein
MVAIPHSEHLKILGSTKEALSTVAVAAGARFATCRHRSGEPIAAACSNEGIPEASLGSERGAVQHGFAVAGSSV